MGHIKPSTADDVQAKAVKALIGRLLGDVSDKFEVQVNSSFRDVPGKETFMVNWILFEFKQYLQLLIIMFNKRLLK